MACMNLSLVALVLVAPGPWQPMPWSAAGVAPDLASDGAYVHIAWLESGAVGYAVLDSAGSVVEQGGGGGWPGVGNGWAFGPGVAADAEGTHLAWASPKGGDQYDTLYATGAGSWSAPLTLQAGTLRGYGPQVAVDAQGALVAVLEGTDVPFGHVNLYELAGGAIVGQVSALTDARVDDRVDVVAGPGDGERHVLVGIPNPSGAIRWRRSAGPGAPWENPGDLQAPACGARVGQPDGAIAPSGSLHVVYGCGSDGDLGGTPSVRHARITGSNVMADGPVTAAGELEAWHLSLGIGRVAVTSDGTLFVAYLTLDTGALRARWSEDAGSSWSAAEGLAAQGGNAEGRNTPAIASLGGVVFVAYADPTTKAVRVQRAEVAVCQPDCTGKSCGPDGCGGACGSSCEAPAACVGGECVGPAAPPTIEAPWVSGSADGVLDEWAAVAPIQLIAPESWVSTTGAPPPAAEDLSASVRVGWAGDVLRVAVTISDDVHAPHLQAGLLWQGDSVQVAVDVAHDKSPGAYDDDDWEVGVAGEGDVDCYVGPCVTSVGVQSTADGRVVEIDLKGAAQGDSVGLSVIVNEDDGDGREGWLELTPGVGAGKDPSQFATVLLQGEPPPPPNPEPNPRVEPRATTDVLQPTPFADAGVGRAAESVPIRVPPAAPPRNPAAPAVESGGCSSASPGSSGASLLIALASMMLWLRRSGAVQRT